MDHVRAARARPIGRPHARRRPRAPPPARTHHQDPSRGTGIGLHPSFSSTSASAHRSHDGLRLETVATPKFSIAVDSGEPRAGQAPAVPRLAPAVRLGRGDRVAQGTAQPWPSAHGSCRSRTRTCRPWTYRQTLPLYAVELRRLEMETVDQSAADVPGGGPAAGYRGHPERRGRGPSLDHRQDDPPLEVPGPSAAAPSDPWSGKAPPSAPRARPPRRRRSRAAAARMVGRDVVPLAALLVEPQPTAAPLPEVVLPPHPQHRAHPREAVEHDRQQRPIPEPDQGAPVDRLEELPRRGRRQDRPPHGRGGGSPGGPG